jgi:hypothetical protein
MTKRRSRRELMAASAALASGAAAAGLVACGGGDSDEGKTETVSTVAIQGDIELLNVLLDLEHGAIVAYEAILSPQFGPHERAHAEALRRMIRELGGDPAPPRPAAEYRAAFPPLRDERDHLTFALDVETTSIGAYADALGKIATDAVRVTLAEILATESEHAAVVLGRLERPQVPDAFVTGPPPQEEG